MIAAVLLGGVSIFGGKGSIPGVLAGVLLIGAINYALRLGRVSDVVLITVTGLLLIVSVVAPSVGAAHARMAPPALSQVSPAAPPGSRHHHKRPGRLTDHQ